MHATKPDQPALADLPLATIALEIGGRRWTVSAVIDQDALLELAPRFTNIPYGLLLWESAVALATRLAAEGGGLDGRSLLELGAGVGLAGLVARATGARVTQTDHDALALAVARRNGDANGITGIVQLVADWRSWEHAPCYDLIIGADIVYDQSVHADLARIFTRNLAPGGRIVLADPDRPRTLGLLATLEDAGWRLALEIMAVAGLPPARNSATVDISIFTATRPD